jgi:sulfur carrier protein
MIYLNGDPCEHDPGSTVATVLELLRLPREPRGVAVAVDGEVVPRVGWATFAIPDGARVEVLTAMQGG